MQGSPVEHLAIIVKSTKALACRIKLLEQSNQSTQDDLIKQNHSAAQLSSKLKLCKKKLAIMRECKQELLAIQEELKKKLQEQTEANDSLYKRLDTQSSILARKQYQLESDKEKIEILQGQLAVSGQKCQTLTNYLAESRDKYKKQKDILRCAVCFEKTRKRVAYACSHVAVCRRCDKNVNECPICRAVIVMRLNIILP